MRLFARTVFVFALAIAAAFAAAPDRAVADPAAETQAVIERQLEAFQRDDWEGAFEFAAPGIQSRFGDAERFGEMVRRDIRWSGVRRRSTFSALGKRATSSSNGFGSSTVPVSSSSCATS